MTTTTKTETETPVRAWRRRGFRLLVLFALMTVATFLATSRMQDGLVQDFARLGGLCFASYVLVIALTLAHARKEK